MPRGMKKNSSARKVSQRAIEERKQKEEQEAELARQQRIKEENKQTMKDAMITSAGGFLTIGRSLWIDFHSRYLSML